MRNRLLLGVIVAGLFALTYAFVAVPTPVHAADAKNLKVFPKNTSKKDLKKAMKKIADALGVQCDFCHNLDDMSADTEHKEIARGMMKMTAGLNKDHFGGKVRVTCETCHRGSKEPK